MFFLRAFKRRKLYIIYALLIFIMFYNVLTLLKYHSKRFYQIKDNINTNTKENLFKYLNDLNAIIIDIEFLKTLPESAIEFFDENSNIYELTVGIIEESFKKIKNNDLILKYNLTSIHIAYGKLNGAEIATHVYIYFEKFKIQIAIIYTRGEFLWIGKDETNSDSAKWFGDTPRAIQNFSTKAVIFDSRSKTKYSFLIPQDLKRFQFDYENSIFLECNKKAAKMIRKTSNYKYKQNQTINARFKPRIKYLVSLFESFYIKYFFGSGTLLGWYRDCGIIPHTLDVDMYAWAHEYDDRIRKALLGNKIVRIWGRYGFRNDSLELRLTDEWLAYDIIFLYLHNETYQWSAYHAPGMRFIQRLPIVKGLCSAELLDLKIYVPCNTIDFLEAKYGKMPAFLTPVVTGYPIEAVNFKEKLFWSDEKLPYVFRSYDEKGNISIQKSLIMLNNAYYKPLLKKTLKVLPNDESF